MLTSLRTWLAGTLAIGVLALVAAPPALAQTSRALQIDDRGEFFSKDAVRQAQKTIDQIKRDYKKDLLIQTYKKLPDAVAAEYEAAASAAAKNKVLSNWTRDRYRAEGVSGIYVVAVRNPEKLRIRVGDKTEAREFPESSQTQLNKRIISNFKDKKFDDGLIAAVDYVESTLRDNSGKTTTARRTTTAGTTSAAPTKGGPSGIWGLVCIIVVVLLGLWLVFALIRAFTGGGGGGGGGSGGGGGGGGGGFMTGLLGGLFGAAAGMWLYDSFFRSSTPSMGGSAYADSGNVGADDRSTGDDVGGDYGGGGGDDAGGGGGGGDWGGGGDAGGGGGGDWGGGGGDAGGGGGDWGGGGGDWGGGGGGGDW